MIFNVVLMSCKSILKNIIALKYLSFQVSFRIMEVSYQKLIRVGKIIYRE